MSSRAWFAAAVVLGIVIPTAGGCVRSFHHRLPEYRTGGDDLLRPAPRSGIYKIRWTGDGEHFARLGGSERLVHKGDPLGFATGDDGVVVAIAGEEQFELAHLPPHAITCHWYSRGKEATQFGRQLEAAIASAGVVALELGFAMLDAALEGDDDCDDIGAWSSEDDRRRRERRKQREREAAHPPKPPPYPHSPSPKYVP